MNIISTILSFLMPPLAIPLTLFKKLFSWRPPLSTVIVGVLLVLTTLGFGIQTIRIDGFHIRPNLGLFKFTLVSIDGYKEINLKLTNALAERERLEKVARQDQATVNQQSAIISRQLAETTNETHPVSSAQIKDAIAVYASTHRAPECVRGPGSSVLDGKASVRGPDSPTPSGDQSNVAPRMVVISEDELNHWANNTKDLDELRTYLKGLIDRGIAVRWNDGTVHSGE